MPPTVLPSPEVVADALLVGNSGTVLEAVQRYMEDGGAAFLVDALARPVMQAVGDRWCGGVITVAEEHAASELLRELLTQLLPGLGWHQGGPRAVIACVPGEQHLLGARLVAQILALDGWHVRFLGADTPARDLAVFVAREQPAFVGLSVCMAERLEAARFTLELLHRTTPNIPLVAGGRAAGSLVPEEKGTWSVLQSSEELLDLTRNRAGGHLLFP
ncbi:cobalamin B12-binding domain-containing protein [Pyxidicoccus sp. MSG2]|uniref:cobalamin B12-binding domain-containing protein n=1 Tax=Pyxidicoccus sp. MSG2 TaxID=2996790 RepID=UPI0022717E0A|nr:cobalamin-dependent protein [Pyxidicoccus sp. MSG2]MCY1021759.1 cobalamin-dependent protein [Pyxidicoccus sp. MSG2]